MHAGEDNNELEASSDNNVVNTGNNETNASSSTATDIEAPDAAVAAVDAKTADSKGDWTGNKENYSKVLHKKGTRSSTHTPSQALEKNNF